MLYPDKLAGKHKDSAFRILQVSFLLIGQAIKTCSEIVYYYSLFAALVGCPAADDKKLFPDLNPAPERPEFKTD